MFENHQNKKEKKENWDIEITPMKREKTSNIFGCKNNIFFSLNDNICFHDPIKGQFNFSNK
jgi:hypothetical protein